MHDDDPSDLVHDLFSSALFGDSPIGRPVIGTVDSIEGLSRASIAGFYQRRYALPQMVVAASGAVDHARLLRLVRKEFGERLGGDAAPAPVRAGSTPPSSYSRVLQVEQETEQTNLVLGTTGLARNDDRRFALSVLSGALGGGMSSRLFQTVREERGLAYSVFSYATSASDTGQFGVYTGCAAGKVGEVLDLVRAELADVAEHGLRDEEVARSKGNLRGQLVLGLEDTGSRMTRLGKAELVHGDVLTSEQVLERIAAVTPDEVREIARDVLTRPLSLAVVGPVDGADLEAAIA